MASIRNRYQHAHSRPEPSMLPVRPAASSQVGAFTNDPRHAGRGRGKGPLAPIRHIESVK